MLQVRGAGGDERACVCVARSHGDLCCVAAGKTTVARKIIEALHVDWVSILSMDSFYKVLTPAQHEKAAKNEYNFDHPGVHMSIT